MASAISSRRASQCPERDDKIIIICPICWYSYDEIRMPKLLTSCGHTICAECTKSLTSELKIIRCPMDQKETDVSSTPLLKNIQLHEVILAIKSKNLNKTDAICKECGSQMAFQYSRCCNSPCKIVYPNVLCLVCCIEKHNGHNLVSLAKTYDLRCKELSNAAANYKNDMAALRNNIEHQYNDITVQLAKIQSLVQVRTQYYEQEVASFDFKTSYADSEIDFEHLLGKQAVLGTLFASAESALNEVAELNSKILSLAKPVCLPLSPCLGAEAFIGKWKMVESQNFDEYLKVVGVGLMKRKIGSPSKQILNFTGRKWSMVSISPFKTVSMEFELGKEFSEITLDGRRMKSKFTFMADGKLVQQQWRVQDGDIDSKLTRYVKDNKLIMICEAQTVVATRIYEKTE